MKQWKSRAPKNRKKDGYETAIKMIVYPSVILGALLCRSVRKVTPPEDTRKRGDYSTICLSEKEIKIIKKIILNSNKYSWQNVEDIHRLGKCGSSNCYGYRVFYDDGCSRLITIAKEHVED